MALDNIDMKTMDDKIHLLEKVCCSIPPNGKDDKPSVQRYFKSAETSKDPSIIRVLRHIDQIGSPVATPLYEKRGLPKVEFNLLPVQPNSVWLVKLHWGEKKDADGMPISFRKAVSEPGVWKSYQLFSWIKSGPEMGEDLPRMREEFVGQPPTSKQVEDFIRLSMAQPYPESAPCLPNILSISSTLKDHVSALRPFLDSLPLPFSWNVLDAEVEAEADNIRYSGKSKCEHYITIAKVLKERGNKEHEAKNPDAAVTFYLLALGHCEKAMLRLREDDHAMINKVMRLKAVCFANCSCARLLFDQEEMISHALDDAELAIAHDKLYSKGYFRLSRAYQTQGNLAMAKQAIIRALRLPELENNQGLVDRLISLQTGGKGLSKNIQNFEKWYKATQMNGVGGLWRNMCNEHMEKMRCSKAPIEVSK